MKDLVRISNEVPQQFWAIPLSNSINRVWENDKNKSTLKYFTDEIEVKKRAKFHDISIAVARKHKEMSIEKIDKRTSAILNFSRLKKGDGILGIVDNKVEKIGIVDSSQFISGEIKTEINWRDDINKPDDIPIFSKDFEIEKVKNSSTMFELSRPTDSEINKLLISADYEERKKEGEIHVELFYATNRNVIGGLNDLNSYYGTELDKLKFGKCLVNIPKGHVQGEIERPSTYVFFSPKENMKHHVVLEKLEELNEVEFNNWISEVISKK